MASFGHTFDATTVDPLTPYEVLPPGKYLAQIVASEMRVTKDGQGQYLYLEIDVLEGPCAGRKLFDRLNLVHANPEVVEIARRTLSSLCRATGKLQVSDSTQLHLVPFIADVRVRPPKGEYGESNSLRYLPRNPQPAFAGAPTATPAAPAAPAKPQAAPTGGLPWKRQF